MTFFTSGNLFHAYIYGNHRKYPTVFGKLRECLKTVSYAFLDFWKFSKNLWKLSEKFVNLLKFSENFASRKWSENQHPGNRSEYAFWKTAHQPIRMQEIARLYNNVAYYILKFNKLKIKEDETHTVEQDTCNETIFTD